MGQLGKVRTIHSCVIDAAAEACLEEFTKLKFLAATIELPLSVLAPLQTLTALTLRGDFSSLDGVQTLTGLTNLTIQSPSLVDISALSELNKLREINFSTCGALKDITALAAHTKVRSLNLSGTKVTAANIPDVFLPARRPSPVYPAALGKRAAARKKKKA